MARKSRKWADMPDGEDNPLNYAVAQRDQSVLQMVDEAVRHNHVMLAYQPIVTAAQPDKPAFYEGFVRVLDGAGRTIPAGDFIGAIEEIETGRIVDCLALEKGLRALHNHPGLRLAINMSARSIGYGRWMQSLKRSLSKDPTVAERLILEISEGSAMLVPEIVVNFMEEMQRKGVSFALDNFGAGYTSLRHLRNFYFDILKIDGQFIRNIAEDADNQVMVQAIVALARQFDMVTVAERVEKEKDVQFLRSAGVDCLQGYYYGAPTVAPPWGTSPEERASA